MTLRFVDNQIFLIESQVFRVHHRSAIRITLKVSH